MEVKLLTYTPAPEQVVAAAARLCYSTKKAVQVMDDFNETNTDEFISKLVSMGHFSPFEHVSFTFAIDGVSRALSHQLVRHRIGSSFSQKSQRYVKESDQGQIVKPNSITGNSRANEIFDQTIEQIYTAYSQLLHMDIPAEDARYLLPNATVTNLVLTMNARSLLHFFELRCCRRAQWEIRALAERMLELVQGVAPIIFSSAGATCDTQGICYEGKMSCGKVPAEKVIARS
ncbi:MAG: FAD-dependent thymidylate synthase [Bacillota bacterium]